MRNASESLEQRSGIAGATAGVVSALDRPLVWWLGFAVGFAIVASKLRTDASYDLANYHLYNGFAALHGKRALDIFPAQLQTTFFYGLDVVYYLAFHFLNDHPVLINILLSIPYSIAALAIFLAARLFAEPFFRLPAIVSAGAAAFGLTGAATLPTLSTTQAELAPGLAILVALACWLHLEKAGRNTVLTTAGLGALSGVSVGLKLTEAPLFVGMFLAVAVRIAAGKRSALAEAAAFAAGGAVAFFALDGAWMWANWKAYGNPIFPIANNVFRSDLVAAENWIDTRFLPATTAMALVFPAYWAFRPSDYVSELPMRDARILIGWASALLIVVTSAARWVRRRTPRDASGLGSPAFSLAVVFLVAFALWEAIWSIYRYVAVLESLSGVVLLAALPIALPFRGRSWLRSGAFALAAIAAAHGTIHPWWRRVPPGPVAISVRLPPIEANAMVLLLDSQPYAYLGAFMPDSVRVVGVNNNIVHPRDPGRLWSRVETAVRDHAGPLWGVEDPEANPGAADSSLASLGLVRGECIPLDSNLEGRARGRVCRLRRAGAS